jgi:hypothetical protein
VTRRFGKKFFQILEKVAKTVAKSKRPKNIYIKAQFQSLNLNLNQTTFEPLKYPKNLALIMLIKVKMLKYVL